MNLGCRMMPAGVAPEGRGRARPAGTAVACLAAPTVQARVPRALPQACERPDVVEVWDVTAADPKLLVTLKVGAGPAGCCSFLSTVADVCCAA